MKLILALFLCCVTYVIASPICSLNEFLKCQRLDPRGPTRRFIITEEDLDTYCLSVRCTIDYWGRCGTAGTVFGQIDMEKQFRIMDTVLCDKQSPLRQKYLDNSVCLNEAMQQAMEKCQMVDLTVNKDCKKIKETEECFDEVIENQCGRDALEVKNAIMPNDKDLTGC